jgi:autotransporter-associated beta strand protein
MRGWTTDDITIGNAITFSDNPTFTTGTAEKSLIFTGDASLGATRTLTVETGSTVNTAFVEFSGDISGSGFGIIKAGAGSLVLSGNNTYTGDTTVSTGKLIVNGNISTSVLATVAEGATLSGTGMLGATTVNGTLAVGNSPGQMDFTGTLALAGTTIMEIDGNAGAGVTGGQDFVNLTGAGPAGLLTYGGLLTLDIGTILAPGSHSWNLFDMASETETFSTMSLTGEYAGSLLDGDLDGVWDFTDPDNTWQFTESTGVLSLVTTVPEPSVALLGLGGMLLLLRRRMRA